MKNKIAFVSLLLVTFLSFQHNTIDSKALSNPQVINFESFPDDYDDVVIEESENKVVYVNPKERECLAKAIYWEARNQSLEGKIAVGLVVINRVNAGLWNDSICGVIFQGCQFSWVCNGNAKKNPAKNTNFDEQAAWAESISVANELISGSSDIEDITRGATYFHARYVKPNWAKWKKIERTVRIDDHIFYRLREM